MALVQRHLGYKIDKSQQKSDWGDKALTQEQMKYASRDVEVLAPIFEIQCELLEANNLGHIAHLEFESIAPIVEMEYVGMPFVWADAELLREELKVKSKEAMVDLEKEIIKTQGSRQNTLFGLCAGIDINLNSPAQVVKYMKTKLGLDVSSSDVETLKSLDHPFAAKLLKYRGLEKSLQFIEQFDSFGARSGRLYPSYNQARAATGRMSSSKPNGQQIPKRGDNKVFRKLFKTTPGKKLVKVDFAAIELKVMARLAMDKAMIEAITNGVDLHKLTASKTSGKKIEDITKEDRQRAKAVNFGLIYGMSSPTLKKYAWFNYGVRMTEEEAAQTRDRYFDLYKGILNWHQTQKAKMHTNAPYHQHSYEKGYFIQHVAIQQTILGRKRFWPTFAGETTAKPTEFFNSADQGTSADITKMAMVELYKVLPEEARIIAVVHDEIVVECPEAMAEDIAKLTLEVMCRVGSDILHPIEVTAEAEIYTSWGG
jgi:DNA polymerase I-like protein with 3'-5' exonuclease and polymerase domains